MIDNLKGENSVKVREILEYQISRPLPDMTDEDFHKEYGIRVFDRKQRLGMAFIDLIVYQIVQGAASGKTSDIATILDRLIGKAKPAKDITGDQDTTYLGYLEEIAAKEEANPTPEMTEEEIEAEFR